ncbi:uncharacterized protein BO80DRAFT_220660 [Aspergillus ibericus CBS 121593]|uniref:Uncharacterized protein n=1 Tax=Aspergillus ibericus CBS 121593 TaxID=1448316 RepID=A0A395GMB3_9EURO|nr:hypothetical protein BO80DRAFT_220660 [Aspergillus ibericus CBS 121593]RAK96635.1 hypothetical protein BO80DRAFT_220660 [Aspergillus ibericus CBS 121593]
METGNCVICSSRFVGRSRVFSRLLQPPEQQVGKIAKLRVLLPSVLGCSQWRSAANFPKWSLGRVPRARPLFTESGLLTSLISRFRRDNGPYGSFARLRMRVKPRLTSRISVRNRRFVTAPERRGLFRVVVGLTHRPAGIDIMPWYILRPLVDHRSSRGGKCVIR